MATMLLKSPTSGLLRPVNTVLNIGSNWDIALPFNDRTVNNVPYGELFNNTFTGTCGAQVSNGSADTARSLCQTDSAPLLNLLYPQYVYAKGGVAYFEIPCWGPTTSTNTKSPRGEFRSRVTGTGSTRSGDFIGNNNPILNIRGGVLRVPDSGSHRTHIMQFHGDTTAAPPAPAPVSSSAVFMILSFDGDTGSLISTVTTVDQSTNSTLMSNGNNYIVQGLPLATENAPEAYDVTARISMSEALIYWTVVVLATNTVINLTQAIDPLWALVNMYAKAGAYSSSTFLCSTDATTAQAQGYILLRSQVTDYFKSCLTALNLTLQN